MEICGLVREMDYSDTMVILLKNTQQLIHWQTTLLLAVSAMEKTYGSATQMGVYLISMVRSFTL